MEIVHVDEWRVQKMSLYILCYTVCVLVDETGHWPQCVLPYKGKFKGWESEAFVNHFDSPMDLEES